MLVLGPEPRPLQQGLEVAVVEVVVVNGLALLSICFLYVFLPSRERSSPPSPIKDILRSSRLRRQRTVPRRPLSWWFSSYEIRERAPYLGDTRLTIGEPTWKRLDRATVEVLVGEGAQKK